MVFCVEEGSCLVFSNASGSSLPAVHFGKCCVAQNESVGWKDPLVQSIWNSMVDAKIIDCVSGCRLSASCLHHVYERSHCLGTRWCTNDDSCDHGECFILHVSSTAAFYMVSKEDPMQVPRLAPCTITTWGDALSVPIRMGAAEIHHLMGCILCNLRTGVQSVYVVYPRPDMMIRFSERSFLQEHRSSF